MVTIALMASWYQLYRHVSDFVKGIDHYSFERPKRYSITGDINESLLSKDEEDEEEMKKNSQYALSHKLQRQFKASAIGVFILLTANCVVVVYKWLYSNFKNLEDTKNDDYSTDRAFYLIIDICYFVILFVLALVQLIAYVACCILFKRLR